MIDPITPQCDGIYDNIVNPALWRRPAILGGGRFIAVERGSKGCVRPSSLRPGPCCWAFSFWAAAPASLDAGLVSAASLARNLEPGRLSNQARKDGSSLFAARRH